MQIVRNEKPCCSGHRQSLCSIVRWVSYILSQCRLYAMRNHAAQVTGRVYIVLSGDCIYISSLTFQSERSGSVVQCLTRDRGAAGSSLTGVLALCPWARHIHPSLVLVQPRKTCPYITERLLMGRIESNQTNKQTNIKNKFGSSQHDMIGWLLSGVMVLW